VKGDWAETPLLCGSTCPRRQLPGTWTISIVWPLGGVQVCRKCIPSQFCI